MEFIPSSSPCSSIFFTRMIWLTRAPLWRTAQALLLPDLLQQLGHPRTSVWSVDRKSLMSNHMTNFRKSNSFLIESWCIQCSNLLYIYINRYMSIQAYITGNLQRNIYIYIFIYLFGTTVWRLGVWSYGIYGQHGGFRWGTGVCFEVQEGYPVTSWPRAREIGGRASGHTHPWKAVYCISI